MDPDMDRARILLLCDIMKLDQKSHTLCDIMKLKLIILVIF